MRLLLSFSFFLGVIMLNSCEKCKTCSYSYTTTDIIQTVNGEEEVITTHKNASLVVNDTIFNSECIKGKTEFTIENAYKTKGDTTVLANYSYSCKNL